MNVAASLASLAFLLTACAGSGHQLVPMPAIEANAYTTWLNPCGPALVTLALPGSMRTASAENASMEAHGARTATIAKTTSRFSIRLPASRIRSPRFTGKLTAFTTEDDHHFAVCA